MKITDKNKISHHSGAILLIYLLIWLFMWILSGWNTQNADLENYELFYNRDFFNLNILDLADPGFNLINSIFNFFGVSFEKYHIIIYGIIITYICYQVWKRSYRPLLILFIYFFTTYFADVIQLRNFLGLLFLMMGLFALIDKEGKHQKLKFLILNLLATSIHIAFVFYFVFLLVDVKVNPFFLIVGSILLSIFGHSILGYFSTFTYIADNGFLSDRADSYMEDSSLWSVIICTCQYLIHYHMCKRCVKQSNYNAINVDYFMRITVLMSILIVVTSINMTFFRLFRNILLFSSIYLINGYMCKKNNHDAILLTIYFMIMSFFHFWWGDVLPNVNVILSNNSLW